MAEREHTPTCAARSLAAEVARETWRKLWPSHCWTCNGRGGFYIRDLVTGGNALEECSACVMNSACPRCGAADVLGPEPYPHCSNCSWTFDTPGEPPLRAWSCGASSEVAHG